MQFRMKGRFSVAAILGGVLLLGLLACSRPEPLPTLDLSAGAEPAAELPAVEVPESAVPVVEVPASPDSAADSGMMGDAAVAAAGSGESLEAVQEGMESADEQAAAAESEAMATETMAEGMESGAEALAGMGEGSAVAGGEVLDLDFVDGEEVELDFSEKELMAENGGFPAWWGELALPGDVLDSFRHRFTLHLLVGPEDVEWEGESSAYSLESAPAEFQPLFGMRVAGEQVGSALECRQEAAMGAVSFPVGQVAVRGAESDAGMADQVWFSALDGGGFVSAPRNSVAVYEMLSSCFPTAEFWDSLDLRTAEQAGPPSLGVYGADTPAFRYDLLDPELGGGFSGGSIPGRSAGIDVGETEGMTPLVFLLWQAVDGKYPLGLRLALELEANPEELAAMSLLGQMTSGGLMAPGEAVGEKAGKMAGEVTANRLYLLMEGEVYDLNDPEIVVPERMVLPAVGGGAVQK